MLIAISATSGDWNGSDRVRLSSNYVRSIEGAGLVPLIVPPLTTPAQAVEILDACGGLLLTGGEDVDPARYGAVAHPTTGAPNVLRDATELALLAAASARRLPVLAVCRGIQLVNVAMGGTLIQDIPSQRPSAVEHDQAAARAARSHAVSIAPNSLLAAATETREMQVNSYHHQAVDRLASGLRVVATAEDGLIEAAEVEDPAWWLIAVQWHPEDLTTDAKAWDRGIFRAFAERVLR